MVFRWRVYAKAFHHFHKKLAAYAPGNKLEKLNRHSGGLCRRFPGKGCCGFADKNRGGFPVVYEFFLYVNGVLYGKLVQSA